jgi:hypothetical protein
MTAKKPHKEAEKLFHKFPCKNRPNFGAGVAQRECSS